MRDVPKYNPEFHPILPAMFLDAMNISKSVFYAYANADILFDNSLVTTLSSLRTALGNHKNILITGQRKNWNIPLGHKGVLHSVKQVTNISNRIPWYFSTLAMDYFITMPGGFPWSEQCDMAIGLPRYDNALLNYGLLNQQIVIDATKGIVALHQTGKDGNYASHQTENPDYNDICGKIDYMLGSTECITMKVTADYHLESRVRNCRDKIKDCDEGYRGCLKKLRMVYNITKPADI